jgi:hypothetical protein
MSVFYFTCPLKTPPTETNEVFSLNMNDQPIQRRRRQRRLSPRSPTPKTCIRGDSVLATTDPSTHKAGQSSKTRADMVEYKSCLSSLGSYGGRTCSLLPSLSSGNHRLADIHGNA